jgi:RNA polymerase sigma-70 factor (ECF subfamily)
MNDNLEALLRKADVPNPERAEQLWAEYRNGGASPESEQAFRTLLSWYGLAIYRRIWGFVRSDAAEDVFQEVLIELHQERSRLATFDHALRWLRTVSITKCVDAIRREKRRKKRETCRAIAPNAAVSTDQRLDVQDAIAHALQRLPTRQREAVALVFFEEMERQTAAELLGVHRDTLARWLEEALHRLRELVPLPIALLTGGTLGLQALLAAEPPRLSHTFANSLTPQGLVAASKLTAVRAVSSSRAWKHLALATGVIFTGGATFAGWQLSRGSAPDSTLKGPASEPPASPAFQITSTPLKAESVPDRNFRLFHAEVLPAQLKSLRGLVLGDGDVALERVEAFDIRLRCIFALHHKSEDRPGWVSRVEFLHITRPLYRTDSETRTYIDWMDGRELTLVDVRRPVVLWRHPTTRKEVAMRMPKLEAAAAAFKPLPHDARSEDELQAAWERLKAVAAPYTGVWFAAGDAGRTGEVRLEPSGLLNFKSLTGRGEEINMLALRPAPADQPRRLTDGGVQAILSADGQRLEIDPGQPGSKDLWTRTPVPLPQ